jgi:hypothetical protein
MANGDAKPTRAISGQNSQITRTIHDMAYNALTDEIVIPQFYAQAIMTYRGGANGDEKPIRMIMGSNTQIQNPARLGLDAVHKEVYLPLGDQILVFPSDAEGNIPPSRIIKGPDTMLGADALTIDPVNNLLIVSGQRPRARGEGGVGGSGGADRAVGEEGGGSNGQVLIFDRTANGNAKPLRVLNGPHSMIHRTGLITVYPPTKTILVGLPSNEKSSPNNFVGVWKETDDGDVPPRWMIGGPNQLLRQVRGITVVPKQKEVVVSDKYVDAVMTYYFPEIF